MPHFKLPIFYLTDSILKNVRGPYPVLFGRIIVPLYCNCVKQVLNTTANGSCIFPCASIVFHHKPHHVCHSRLTLVCFLCYLA